MFGFKSLMAKMLFGEVFSAVLNSKIHRYNHEKKLQTIVFSLSAIGAPWLGVIGLPCMASRALAFKILL